MLTQDQVLQIKSRLLTCGQIAGMLCKQAEDGEQIELTPEKYEYCMNCLGMLDGDVRAMCGDYDILRGMITGDFNLIEPKPQEGEVQNDRGNDQPVVEQQDPEPRPVDGDNGEGGSNEERKKRPAASRNKRRSRKKKAGVDRTTDEQEVDSSSKLV